MGAGDTRGPGGARRAGPRAAGRTKGGGRGWRDVCLFPIIAGGRRVGAPAGDVGRAASPDRCRARDAARERTAPAWLGPCGRWGRETPVPAARRGGVGTGSSAATTWHRCAGVARSSPHAHHCVQAILRREPCRAELGSPRMCHPRRPHRLLGSVAPPLGRLPDLAHSRLRVLEPRRDARGVRSAEHPTPRSIVWRSATEKRGDQGSGDPRGQAGRHLPLPGPFALGAAGMGSGVLDETCVVKQGKDGVGGARSAGGWLRTGRGGTRGHGDRRDSGGIGRRQLVLWVGGARVCGAQGQH